MPYYHKDCEGRVSFWTRKCDKCKKRWGILTWLWAKPPEDMYYVFEKEIPKLEMGETSYAKWADKVGGVPEVASHFPNWPRWARFLTLIAFAGVTVIIILWIRGFF